MNRQNVYNPLLKLFQANNLNSQNKASLKLFSPAASKQDFFTLKKNISKRSVYDKKSQLTNICHTLSRKDSSNSSKYYSDQVDISLDFISCSIDDEVKTTSTKSYDTHEDAKSSKISYNKKKTCIPLIQVNGTALNSKQKNVFHGLKHNLNAYKQAFKSQFLNQKQIHSSKFQSGVRQNKLIVRQNKSSIRQYKSGYKQSTTNIEQNSLIVQKGKQKVQKGKQKVQKGKQKVLKNEILLKFKQNIKRKLIHPPKLKHFFIFPKPIGKGTYSTVYKAIHRKTGMVCALKALQKQNIVKLNLVSNIIQQIKIMLLYPHQNIVSLWGFFEEGDKFYMVLQYCTDGDLYKLIEKKQANSFNTLNEASLNKNQIEKQIFGKKVSYIHQVTKALQFLHSNQIMHRDIKPQNILLNFGQTSKISDFGWAKIIKCPDDQLRRTLCGTPLYLAPEQIRQSPYNKSVDLWAVGILTYELLTGKIPFIIQSIQDLHKIVNEQVSFSQLNYFPYASDFVSLLLEKDGIKRREIHRLSDHKFFQILNQFSQERFMLQLQFDKIL